MESLDKLIFQHIARLARFFNQDFETIAKCSQREIAELNELMLEISKQSAILEFSKIDYQILMTSEKYNTDGSADKTAMTKDRDTAVMIRSYFTGEKSMVKRGFIKEGDTLNGYKINKVLSAKEFDELCP